MSVFISHSLEDFTATSVLTTLLEEANIPFWSSSHLKLGEPLAEQLCRAIEKSTLCIFYATKKSVSSQWCLAELGDFWGARKKVIVFMADSDLSDSMLPQFNGNFTTNDAQRLIESIRDVHKEQPPAAILDTRVDEIIEYSELPIYLTDEKFDVVACNEEFLKLLQLTRGEALGRNVEDLVDRLSEIVPEATRTQYKEEQKRVLEEGGAGSRNLHLVVEVDPNLRPGAVETNRSVVSINAHIVGSELDDPLGSFVVYHLEEV